MSTYHPTDVHADQGKLTRASDPVEFTADHSSFSVSPPIDLSEPEAHIPDGSGRYQIIDEIAHGGMGVIYRATDTALGREVAVKTLSERYAIGSGGARRFTDEARITAQLQHPGIPPVHDLGILENGRPFLAMKLIKGQTLSDLLERRPDPSFDRGRFVAIFEQTCQAVAYAHAHHVVHRDLKPSNVMVGSFGEVQVMDWGLAKVLTGEVFPVTEAPPDERLDATIIRGSESGGGDVSLTQMGSILGTLPFMPPEQAAGEINKIGTASDVFSLGGILAVILTGEPPYTGAEVEGLRVSAIRGDLTDCLARIKTCGAAPELVALCQRCLAFAPEDRPHDAGAVTKEVARLRAASEERAREAEKERADTVVKTAEQKAKRRRQRAAAVTVAMILLLIGGSGWLLDRQSARFEKQRAVEAERNLREAAAALSQAEEALVFGDLEATDLALALTQERLDENSPPGITKRLAAAKKDRDFVRGLREIEDIGYFPGAVSSPLPAEMAKRYEDLFANYGLNVGTAEPANLARSVRSSRVSAALHSGLGEWFCTEPKSAHLCELLDYLDPETDRVAIRSAIQAKDEPRLRSLVGALDASDVPAWFAASIGFHPLVPQEDGVRLMSATWRTHPSDYMLAYRCCRRLWGTQRLDEMLAWAKVAVALQPKRASAHSALVMAWQAKRNWDEAEASARLAIELGRKYPNFPGDIVLGNVLMDKGDLDGAEEIYLAALKTNPKPGTYHKLGMISQKRNDILGAEDWFRRALESAPESHPTRDYYRTIYNDSRHVREWQEQVASGQIEPPNPTAAIGVSRLARHPSKRQFARAVELYLWAFERDPALVNNIDEGLRRDAALCAVMAATGKDKTMPRVEPPERQRLLRLAMAWLRADLAQMGAQADDAETMEKRGKWLSSWKELADLAPVRCADSLAEMDSADREAWEAFWRDVDVLLATKPNPNRRAARWAVTAGGVVRVNGEGRDIGSIADLPKASYRLTSVNLANRSINDASLANLDGVEKLTQLNLQGTGVTDAGLMHLKKLSSVNTLILTNTAISGEGLVHLSQVEGRVELWLKGTPFNDAGMRQLRAIKGLWWLTLANTKITDAGLTELAECKQLRELGLDATGVTDAGLLHVGKLNNIRMLWLHDTSITDEGLVHLKGLSGLSRIAMQRTRVTEKGLRDFQASVPGCAIEWDGGIIDAKH